MKSWLVNSLPVQDAGAVAALLKRDRQRLSAEARGLSTEIKKVMASSISPRYPLHLVLQRGCQHTTLTFSKAALKAAPSERTAGG